MALSKFIFAVKTLSGGDCEVVGYLPFEGAEFCAHRHLEEFGLWNVAHARTSLRLPIGSLGSCDEAVALAKKLSERCPSAREIGWDGSNNGEIGHASGPVKALAAEVKAVLAEAA
jgi:hypothetical protein